MMIHGHPI